MGIVIDGIGRFGLSRERCKQGRPQSEVVLYLIETQGHGCLFGGAIEHKIGRTLPSNEAKRYSDLQTGCPSEHQVILRLIGPSWLEPALHSLLRKYSVRAGGEWYCFVRGLLTDEYASPPLLEEWRSSSDATIRWVLLNIASAVGVFDIDAWLPQPSQLASLLQAIDR